VFGWFKRGREAPLIRAGKSFEVGGLRVEFVGRSGMDAWCLLVAGRRLPMTFKETECVVTNAASYDKTLRRPKRVEWAPIGAALASASEFEVFTSPAGTRARCDIERSKAEMYNTVIYDSTSLVIELPPDLSVATVTLHHHTDSSS